jgi:hypothetical protein
MKAAGRIRAGALAALVLLACLQAAACSGSSPPAASPVTSPPTVWVCRPGMADDPCAISLATTQVADSGATQVVTPRVAPTAGRFDCFYVYPRIGAGAPPGSGAGGGGLALAPAPESVRADVAMAEAARLSQVCRVWAPFYNQAPRPGPAGFPIAYASVAAAFEDYLTQDNDGRPIVFIGHSEGAATLIGLLSRLVDGNRRLRSRMVLAILLGGNVQVQTGGVAGGSFSHIPLCSSPGQAGCVIAYSSFPAVPPAGSMFGRPGQGISLTSGQTATSGQQVACVNPAAVGGGTADLDPIFSTQVSFGAPATSPALEASVTTPWIAFPGLYQATCEHGDGATWLQVSKATAPSDHRPLIGEALGPAYGYHQDDEFLALGNLVADVAAAESTWSHR